MDTDVEYAALELRLKNLLPEEYQDSYNDVQPVSMGSASLKYLRNGLVAWNEVWGTFCDLAMAGGPPHKGTFLQPAPVQEIESRPDQYERVVEEICRGATMVTGLPATASPVPGWVRFTCDNDGMAEWLVRAVVMENVAARSDGAALDLPAGPGYRVEKEIKNVITVIAKTCHYWFDHMWAGQRQEISELLAKMALELPLVKPTYSDQIQAAESRALSGSVAEKIHRATGLPLAKHPYDAWAGVGCPDVHAAIWMMRALVANNILSRREGTTLFVPINPTSDPTGEIVVQAVMRVQGFAKSQGVLGR